MLYEDIKPLLGEERFDIELLMDKEIFKEFISDAISDPSFGEMQIKHYNYNNRDMVVTVERNKIEKTAWWQRYKKTIDNISFMYTHMTVRIENPVTQTSKEVSQ